MTDKPFDNDKVNFVFNTLKMIHDTAGTPTFMVAMTMIAARILKDVSNEKKQEFFKIYEDGVFEMIAKARGGLN